MTARCEHQRGPIFDILCNAHSLVEKTRTHLLLGLSPFAELTLPTSRFPLAQLKFVLLIQLVWFVTCPPN